MPNPDPFELEIVRLAITLGNSLGGCCEWNTSAGERLMDRPPFPGFTLDGVRALLCDFVCDQPEAVQQVAEQRREYRDRRYYYKVIVPIKGVAKGLFIELILLDDDPDYPVVSIVNAHEQGK